MRTTDVMLFGWRALHGYRTRTVFMLIAMSIGVAAVMMLTALGEGAQRYVRNEFASLGTNLVIILPGRSETSGVGLGTIMGVTPRDLTLADAKALTQHPAVARVAPINVGAAEASWQNRKREVTVLGSTNEILEVRHWQMERGKFLPKGDWDRASSVCVLGAKIRDELFGAHSAIGQWVRLGENRYRVIGVMASEGRSIGVDVEEVVIIPVAAAQSLFNVPSLFRVLIEARSHTSIPRVIDFAKETSVARQQGNLEQMAHRRRHTDDVGLNGIVAERALRTSN